jgi:exodeoxyribonuclease VII small subunit
MVKEFETNLQRLEDIVNQLDNTQVSLHEGLELLEEGIRLIKECNLDLEKAKGKLEMLLEGDKGITVWNAEDLEGDINEF